MDVCLGTPDAEATVKGQEIHGRVEFYPLDDGTLVAARIAGLPDSGSGFFAFHIHELGDCTGENFPNTGPHYGPGMVDHPNHAGDLPPLLSWRGDAYLAVWTGRFQPEDVIGRSIVIHAQPDDFRTQPAGNPGKKLACGEIRRIY